MSNGVAMYLQYGCCSVYQTIAYNIQQSENNMIDFGQSWHPLKSCSLEIASMGRFDVLS